MTLNEKDYEQLKSKGISEATLNTQLHNLKTGFPYLNVLSPATPGNGILCLTDQERNKYIGEWERFLRDGGSVVKMVPASGAASRMFKNLFAFVADGALTPFMEDFFDGLHDFAFFNELNETCRRLYGQSADELMACGRRQDIVRALINPEGMNYGQLPKALLTFHKAGDSTRTPLEEHLAEGAGYTSDAEGNVHVHFTVSPDHIDLMKAKISESLPAMEKEYGKRFTVDMSIQKPSTDTVAANLDGSPYREDGELFFRPAGHGALLENLNDLKEEVVFIKNIDNVVPDALRGSTLEYKKVIGGLLVDTHNRILHYSGMLRTGLPSRPVLNEILNFLRDTLFITGEGAEDMEDLELADYLLCKLDRPVRVCGMVRNDGEPGGGPFLTQNPDGTISPQILESSQLNPKSADTERLLSESTHFNPVDLVCFIHDLDGETFNLQDFVDPDTGFISQKSRKGVEIKALELPGLWNGSMSEWNTIFVEVPADTFNPVKTVNDLLRPVHKN